MKAYMCLTCKVGSYNKILNELQELKVPRSDIFLLFGTFDILIQFSRLKNLDEFIKMWFNPVRMIGANDALITKTFTFIVISEGPLLTEVPFAFIFLNTKPQTLDPIKDTLLKIPEVLSADTVFGHYDLICSIKAKDRVDLERIISHIHSNVFGIDGAMTVIVTMETMFFI